jgi:hypothetical protein
MFPYPFKRDVSIRLDMIFIGTMKHSAAAWLGASILLIASCSTWARSDTPAVSDYMNCARGLGVAIDNQFVVLTGERFGDRGLYLYTDQGAFFLPLGAPDSHYGEAQEFFLRAKISSVGDILLNFREKKPGSKSNIEPGISYQWMTPSTSGAGNYRATPAYASFDDQARNLLRQRLREKVATIKNFIDDKNRYSTPADAKLTYEKDRAIYLAKLERCRFEGDRMLNSAVAEEAQKLESGFPGVTIWEKEIGASLASLSQ